MAERARPGRRGVLAGQSSAGRRGQASALPDEASAIPVDLLLEALPDPMFIVDAGYTLIRASTSTIALAGGDVGRGGRCYEVVFGLPSPCEGCPLVQALASPSPTPGPPVRTVTGDAPRAYDRIFLPLPGGRALEYLRDRSREAQLRHDLTAAEQHARIGRIAASLAHDLRGSLLVISAAAEALRETSEEDAVELRGMIFDEVHRLETFSRDLVAYATPVPVERRPIDLAEIVMQTLLGIERVVADQKLQPIHEIPDDLPPVWADAESLRRALGNLLTNAAHYAGYEGHVAVVASLDRGTVRLRVEDDGPGVPHDIRREIFEPFFTTRPGGSGLGLANSRRLIELCGGTLELVTPRTLRGAAFEIALSTEE